MVKPKYNLCLVLTDTEAVQGDKGLSQKVLRALVKEALSGYGFQVSVIKSSVKA